MKIATSDNSSEFMRSLMGIPGMPQRMTELTIHAKVDRPVEFTATCLLQDHELETKRFRLYELDETGECVVNIDARRTPGMENRIREAVAKAVGISRTERLENLSWFSRLMAWLNKPGAWRSAP